MLPVIMVKHDGVIVPISAKEKPAQFEQALPLIGITFVS